MAGFWPHRISLHTHALWPSTHQTHMCCLSQSSEHVWAHAERSCVPLPWGQRPGHGAHYWLCLLCSNKMLLACAQVWSQYKIFPRKSIHPSFTCPGGYSWLGVTCRKESKVNSILSLCQRISPICSFCPEAFPTLKSSIYNIQIIKEYANVAKVKTDSKNTIFTVS